jgi:hypothetical protein
VPTIITDDRAAALRVGYEATDWSAAISFDDYERALGDWTVQALQRDGETIGAVFTKGDEIHVSVRPDWRRRWATKGLLRVLLAKPVCTRVTPGHEYMNGILKRLGFNEQPDGLLVKGVGYGH